MHINDTMLHIKRH